MPVLTNINKNQTGTCPHGLPQGACPVCSGGGMKKADFSAKPGEMSWNECAAIGAFLKAQKNAKLQREQDARNFAAKVHSFQNALIISSQKLAAAVKFFTNRAPAVISKPVTFLLNTVLGGTLRAISNLPYLIRTRKMADISDKLTAIFGEIKASAAKKISESFKNLKKKFKSLFSIFKPLDADNDEKQIDETKKAFELRTFIHNLYKKITGDK